MRNILNDIIRHTEGNVDPIKISGDSKSTSVEGQNDKRTIIFKAELKKPVPEFAGEFGITNQATLKGIVNHAPFKTEKAKIEIIRRAAAENEVGDPETLVFKGEPASNQATYRLMAKQHIPPQGVYKGKNTWEIEASPSKSVVNEFSSIASLYTTFDPYFHAKIINGNLHFLIGDEGSSMHRCSVLIQEGVKGTETADNFWLIDEALPIIKMGADENLKIKINPSVLLIEMETDIATYRYYLPARKK